jgi:hypothetical protein
MVRRARGDGRVRPVSRSAPVGQRKGRGGGRKEKGAPTGGTDVLATAGKGKRRRGRGPLQKGINGPAGRLGRKEGEVPFLFSFFKPF